MILDQTSKSLYTVLSGGTALTSLLAGTTSIYDTQAPDNATLPYIVFGMFSGGPENIDPNHRENNLWYIRAYSASGAKNASEIFEQADNLLNRINPVIVGVNTLWSARQQNIVSLDNTPSGKIWNSGGLYEIRTSEYIGYDWYVDSVNGSDSNDGQSAEDAYATIAQLLTVMQAGDSVALAKGSHWREKLTLPGSNCSVASYGTGDKPILDASDIITAASITKTAGYTNVYQATVTPEWGTTNWLNMWEDDSFLTRAATLAACDSTPGSCFPSASTGTITLYFHASDSSSPITNGKVYEFSKRLYGIDTDSIADIGISITGVHTRRNLGEPGSILLGNYATLTDCLCSDGSKHNLYFGEGSTVTNVTARNAYYNTSLTYFVCYVAAATGLGFTLSDCTAENTSGVVDANATGFYCHSGSGSLGAVVYSNLVADGLNVGLDTGPNFDTMTITTIDATTCNYGVRVSKTTTISGLTHNILTNMRSIQILASGVTLNLSDSTLALTGVYSGGHIYSADTNVTVNLDNVHFIENNSQNIIYMGGTGCAVYARNCDFEKVNRVYNIASTGTVDSDYNRFRDAASFILNGTTYTTIALWQSGTGNDLNSTIG